MIGPKQEAQAALFYEFFLEDHIPQNRFLRSIDRFLDLSGIRQYLAQFYSHTGRPSIDPPEANGPTSAAAGHKFRAGQLFQLRTGTASVIRQEGTSQAGKTAPGTGPTSNEMPNKVSISVPRARH